MVRKVTGTSVPTLADKKEASGDGEEQTGVQVDFYLVIVSL